MRSLPIRLRTLPPLSQSPTWLKLYAPLASMRHMSVGFDGVWGVAAPADMHVRDVVTAEGGRRQTSWGLPNNLERLADVAAEPSKTRFISAGAFCRVGTNSRAMRPRKEYDRFGLFRAPALCSGRGAMAMNEHRGVA